MDLYILRHGIAEPHDAGPAGRDSERQLTPEGAKKMRRIAKGMKSAGDSFDLILSSPYLRAKQTADIVAKVLGREKKLESCPALAADGNPKELLDLLKGRHHKKKSVLLVGHEPYLSRLISLLISGDTRIAITLKKGGLAKLAVNGLHYGRCASLEWLLAPGQLKLRN